MSNVSRKFVTGGGGTLVAMTTETAKKKRAPQILKKDTALKLVSFSSFKQPDFGIEESEVLISLENHVWISSLYLH